MSLIERVHQRRQAKSQSLGWEIDLEAKQRKEMVELIDLVIAGDVGPTEAADAMTEEFGMTVTMAMVVGAVNRRKRNVSSQSGGQQTRDERANPKGSRRAKAAR